MPGGNRRFSNLIDCRRYSQWLLNQTTSGEMSVELGDSLRRHINGHVKIICEIEDRKETGMEVLEERLAELERQG
jgi:hypothetical protein